MSTIPIEVGAFHILPVQHERLEYADEVRRVFHTLRPDAVAVEVPSSLEPSWLRGIDRLPSISVLLFENAEGRTIYLTIAPSDPMVEAARLARENGLPLRCSDLDVDGYADYRDPVPDSYAVFRLGLSTVYREFRTRPRRPDPQDEVRERSMAFHAAELNSAGARRVLVVCGMHHADQVASQLTRTQAAPLTPPRRKNVRLVHLHPDSLGEVLTDIPFYSAAYEVRRRTLPVAPPPARPPATGRDHGPFRVISGGGGENPHRLQESVVRAALQSGGPDLPGIPPALDRLKLQWSLLRETERMLVAAAPDEEVRPWQRTNLARFTRNLARIEQRLIVDSFDLIAAARGCVSENFAWELHRLAIGYPAQSASATDIPTARIRADELFDGVRRLKLQRRLRRTKQPDLRSLFKRKRRSERFPGEWLEGFDGEAICSYPPEDLLIENFGRYLQKRGKSVLSEERSRTVPFTTSVLDGIDVRETIRNWHEGRIMVRELGRAPGEIGSVVVILDEDRAPGDERFSYLQTWHGEHDQESDMAFYCTEPGQAIVGPGISRVTYGGFLLSYPPQRMADVWTDPDYRIAECKSEILLLAALDYSTEKTVIYVAARPPRSILRQFAARMGLKILYLPLGVLSPTTLKRVRVMHILSGYDKRDAAKDYIW